MRFHWKAEELSKFFRDNTKKNTEAQKEDASISPSDYDKFKIIPDGPITDFKKRSSLDFNKYSNSLANIIKNSPPSFSVGVFGGWGTGKTTLMRMIEDELSKDHNILPVWFNAWRYEREEHLAVIPFLRIIRIALSKKNYKKRSGWNEVSTSLGHTFDAFLESTQFTAGLGSAGSLNINLGEFRNSLKSKGSNWVGGRKTQIHDHPTDYLKTALENLRLLIHGARIVVFIDDLDRCVPEKALEVLESIKAFFDIEGIVYVMGMNHSSIDALIKQKYGDDSDIKGLDYLEKIVQLPFQIPTWNDEDISKFTDDIISDEFVKGSRLANELSSNKSLLVNATKNNPREVKRFINSVILASSVFRQPIEDKPVGDIPMKDLIAIQALRFQPEWNRFLEFITQLQLKGKKEFLEKYKQLADGKEDTDKVQKDMIRDFPGILEAYDSFFNRDDPLRKFLDLGGAADILLDIEDMNKYRRALDTVVNVKEFFIKSDLILDGDLMLYENREFDIRIQYPAEWEPHENKNTNMITFRPKTLSTSDTVFLIRVDHSEAKSLNEEVEKLINTKKWDSRDFNLYSRREVKLAGEPAIEIKYTRKAPMGQTNSTKAVNYLIIKNEKAYTLGYHEDELRYHSNYYKAQKMFDSFEFIKVVHNDV